MTSDDAPGGARPSGGVAVTAEQGAYTTAVGDVATDRATVLGLWRGTLDEAEDPAAKFQWFYCDHPDGPSTMVLLLHGPERTPVGTAGIGGRELHASGVVHRGGVLADLLVVPSHRTLFPAMELQRAATRTGLATRSVVFGVPNEKAVPVFRRLGYSSIGDLVRYVVVLRYGELLGKRLPRWLAALGGFALDRLSPLFRRMRAAHGNIRGDWTDAVDARFDALWNRARSFDGVIGVRDARYLHWRFLARPTHPHRVFALTTVGTSELVGYAVCEDARPTLHVRDFLADRALRGGVATLVDALARRARAEGYSTLSLDFMGGATDSEALRGAGMTERDRRPLFASFAGGQGVTLRQSNWYITRADIDA